MKQIEYDLTDSPTHHMKKTLDKLKNKPYNSSNKRTKTKKNDDDKGSNYLCSICSKS